MKNRMGCRYKEAHATVKHIIEALDPRRSARMVMQARINPDLREATGEDTRKDVDMVSAVDAQGQHNVYPTIGAQRDDDERHGLVCAETDPGGVVTHL